MSPTSGPGAKAPALRLKLVLALYVLAAAFMPFAHHDIVCHLKGATHCHVCAAGSSGDLTPEPTLFGRFMLKDAGEASSQSAPDLQSSPRPSVSGRAPPAAD